MLDTSKPCAEVWGMPGVRWTQNGKFYNNAHEEVSSTGEKVESFRCPHCDFEAKNEMGLKSHSRIHK